MYILSNSKGSYIQIAKDYPPFFEFTYDKIKIGKATFKE